MPLLFFEIVPQTSRICLSPDALSWLHLWRQRGCPDREARDGDQPHASAFHILFDADVCLTPPRAPRFEHLRFDEAVYVGEKPWVLDYTVASTPCKPVLQRMCLSGEDDPL